MYSIFKGNLRFFFASSLVTFALLGCFLIFPEQTKSGIHFGLGLCNDVVIPSVFPFVFICNFVCNTNFVFESGRFFKWLNKILFGKFYSFFGVWLLSLLGGYPVGTIILCGLYENGEISKDTARKMAYFTVNPSVGFVVGSVGGVMLNNIKSGWIIFGITSFSSLTVAVVATHFMKSDGVEFKIPEKNSVTRCFVNAVSDASKTVIAVCATVVLFGAITETIKLLPENISCVIIPLLEVTNACELLSHGFGSLKLLAFVIAFGGLGVHFQILVLGEKLNINFGCFFLLRFLTGALSYGITFLFLKVFPQTIETVSNVAEPVAGFSTSPMASASLIITCFILLCSLKFGKEKMNNEKCQIF